jgi:2-keto-4-pentenoate hydratase
MDAHKIQQAAALLTQARRAMQPLPGLPEALRPVSIAEAHAIQDATTARLGTPVGGYKASAPADGEPTRGVIYADTILPSPAKFPAARVPACGIEAEVAFLFTRDFPPRDHAYLRHDVVAGTAALVAIEIVDSRYGDLVKDPGRLSKLELLADSTSNGGFVFSQPVRGWTSRVVSTMEVTLTVNGETIVRQKGGHPTGDPFAAAVALVDMMRRGAGIQAGQYVTCGSWTGLRFFRPGDHCVARIAGLGEAELTFTV